jgi:hypothetical protein
MSIKRKNVKDRNAHHEVGNAADFCKPFGRFVRKLFADEPHGWSNLLEEDLAFQEKRLVMNKNDM